MTELLPHDIINKVRPGFLFVCPNGFALPKSVDAQAKYVETETGGASLILSIKKKEVRFLVHILQLALLTCDGKVTRIIACTRDDKRDILFSWIRNSNNGKWHYGEFIVDEKNKIVRSR